MENELCSGAAFTWDRLDSRIHWLGRIVQVSIDAIGNVERSKLLACKLSIFQFENVRRLTFTQINIIVLLGFMSFSTSAFWLSLYMQDVLRYSALEVAVHLLPQAIGGILVNIIAGMVLHKVDNKILTGIGALSYLGSALLLANIGEGSSYWAFIFPSLILTVIGADLQFNVANVCPLLPTPSSHPLLTANLAPRCTLCPPYRITSNPSLAEYSTR